MTDVGEAPGNTVIVCVTFRQLERCNSVETNECDNCHAGWMTISTGVWARAK
jgi:hypothetical protein